MSRQSSFTRTAFTAVAALLMSSVAIGTAVGPAHAVAAASEAPVNA